MNSTLLNKHAEFGAKIFRRVLGLLKWLHNVMRATLSTHDL